AACARRTLCRPVPAASSSLMAARRMTARPRGVSCGLSPSAPNQSATSSSDWPPPIASAIMVVYSPSGPSMRCDAQVRGRPARPSGLLPRPLVTWENLIEELRVPFHLIGEEEQGAVRLPAGTRGNHIVTSEFRQVV